MSDYHFLRRGNAFFIHGGAGTQMEQLPPGTFTVEHHPDHGLYLMATDDVGAPGRLYGNTEARAKRVLQAFRARPGITTGVLLTGTKGTGKTLLAKKIIELARQHQYPTLLIGSAYAGPAFTSFLSAIQQPCVVLIDEAEKLYHEKERQDQLLTVLDGCHSSHKLFIFVVNENTLEDTFSNRPGRLHYRWNYSRLERAVALQYGRDNLKNQEHLVGLLRVLELAPISSFDVLKGLVWEMNQFGESAAEAVKNLNIDQTGAIIYHVEVRAISGAHAGRQWTTSAHYSSDKACTLNLAGNNPQERTEEDYAAIYAYLQAQHERTLAIRSRDTWQPAQPTMEAARAVGEWRISSYELQQHEQYLTPEVLAVLKERFLQDVTVSFCEEDLASEDLLTGELEFHCGDFIVKLQYINEPNKTMKQDSQPAKPMWTAMDKKFTFGATAEKPLPGADQKPF